MPLTGPKLAAACLVLFALVALGLLIQSAQVLAQNDYIDPATGYRISHYQAVVPDTVAGGTRVDTREAEEIFKNRAAAFIDVSPSVGASFDPDTGAWRLTSKHRHIPGSIWLPDVGRGVPGPTLERYFSENLDKITGADKSGAILIYCKADCWMGWNAVKRAASYGYTNILWYPDGIEGWTDWDNPTTAAEPVPARIGDEAK